VPLGFDLPFDASRALLDGFDDGEHGLGPGHKKGGGGGAISASGWRREALASQLAAALRVVTIFSASNYGGVSGNRGARWSPARRRDGLRVACFFSWSPAHRDRSRAAVIFVRGTVL